MYTVALFGILTTSLYYLGSRARITSWLWSRYPRRLALFMDCPACSGAWYGLLVALVVGRHADLSYAGLAARDWLTPIVVMLCSIALTPIGAGLMQWGFDHNGAAVQDDEGQPG